MNAASSRRSVGATQSPDVNESSRPACFKDKQFNPFATAGATGQMFDDISPGNFDGPSLGFIGEAKIHSSQATGTPIGTSLPSGTPGWGQGWKEGLLDWYDHR